MKYLILLSFALVGACSSPQPHDPQAIVDKAIEVHGSFMDKQVSFTFRDREYSVRRSAGGYTYTRSWQDDSLGFVQDVLVNSRLFHRLVDGDTVAVTEEWAAKYSESVNSVLYFFQLPYVLNDAAAIKKYVGACTIKDEPYLQVQVTFNPEGGGKDHEDVFMYWFHRERGTLDFLAYSYLTEGGGVRFREAINRKEMGGLLIQDYVNYKADKTARLEDLPALFESGKLENLSLIVNERVRVGGTN